MSFLARRSSGSFVSATALASVVAAGGAVYALGLASKSKSGSATPAAVAQSSGNPKQPTPGEANTAKAKAALKSDSGCTLDHFLCPSDFHIANVKVAHNQGKWSAMVTGTLALNSKKIEPAHVVLATVTLGITLRDASGKVVKSRPMDDPTSDRFTVVVKEVAASSKEKFPLSCFLDVISGHDRVQLLGQQLDEKALAATPVANSADVWIDMIDSYKDIGPGKDGLSLVREYPDPYSRN